MSQYSTISGTDIATAKLLLESGQVVAIPTETVYGLAANAFDSDAVYKIFQAKSRPASNPLIVHVGSVDQLQGIVSHVPDAAIRLFGFFAPGPLTLLLPKKDRVPDIVTAGLPRVAVRIPAHPLTLSLLQSLDFPLAAPSANPSGYISPTSAQHVMQMLGGKIPYILDGGECKTGIESTIVGFENEQPVIYRQGTITKDDIEKCLGSTSLYHGVTPVAPGSHTSHYSPHTPLYLTHDIEAVLNHNGDKNVGLLTYNEYSDLLPESQQIVLYTSDNLTQGAANLYAALHDMDSRQYAYIIAKKLPDHGIGAAINDRLWRASIK